MTTGHNARRLDVFFYGLFMDEKVLRDYGVQPQDAEQAIVEGFALRIGQRATLIPSAGDVVYGITFSLTQAELDLLYAGPSVTAYRPHAVLARLESGDTIPALCYSLPDYLPSDPDPVYKAKLRDVAERVRLPRPYIESLG